MNIQATPRQSGIGSADDGRAGIRTTRGSAMTELAWKKRCRQCGIALSAGCLVSCLVSASPASRIALLPSPKPSRPWSRAVRGIPSRPGGPEIDLTALGFADRGEDDRNRLTWLERLPKEGSASGRGLAGFFRQATRRACWSWRGVRPCDGFRGHAMRAAQRVVVVGGDAADMPASLARLLAGAPSGVTLDTGGAGSRKPHLVLRMRHSVLDCG